MNKPSEMITIFIDSQDYQVNKNDNLLANVLSQKLDLPYFCWHPSMGSVGACRQCAVTQYQDENDDKGRLVMACTTPVTDGMRISLQDKPSSEFREQIIAAMMTNHPHDCPVCAEGGECHLQDMTVMTGHSARDYQGEKRTFTNQDLGQFVGHEMNRCITCYRCVRFYNDYAGGDDFGVYGSKNQVYFGRQQDGQLTSEFSGNLVEVCPTGVFTNKMFSAHYTRKWDLQSAPSVCSHCSAGCNTSIGERYGSVRRVSNRFNDALNGYFLCDSGRYGTHFVNSSSRLTQTKGIAQSSPVKLSELDVLKVLAQNRGKSFIGIGSARASLEANTMLKAIVGTEHFSTGLSDVQTQIAKFHHNALIDFKQPTIKQIEASDCIAIFHEDISHSAPRIALAIRQALQSQAKEKAQLLGIPSWQDSAVRTIGGKDRSPLYIVSDHATKLDDVAEQVLLQPQQATVELLECFIELLEQNVPLEKNTEHSIFNDLINARNPLMVIGWDCLSAELFSSLIHFAQLMKEELVQKEKTFTLLITPPKANSVGLMLLMNEQTLSLPEVVNCLTDENNKVAGAVILENELEELSKQIIDDIKCAGKKLIVIDHSESLVSQKADIVLPAAAISESSGHLVNYQGMMQSFHPALAPKLPVQENWRWLNLIARGLCIEHKLVEKFTHLSALHPVLATYDDIWHSVNNEPVDIARETHRTSGRTAKLANQSVHEPKVTQSLDGYRFSMEGKCAEQASNKPFVWSPGWNSNQAVSQYFPPNANGNDTEQSGYDIAFASRTKLVVAELEKQKKTSNTQEQPIAVITPWHQRDWQVQLVAEFKLLNETNKVYLSAEGANEHHWHQGQWLAIIPNSTNDENTSGETLFAQLIIDSSLPNTLAYGSFNEVGNTSISAENIRGAKKLEVERYLAEFATSKETAEIDKQQTLERLKIQDQTVPIRFVAGGLDDA